MKPITIILLLFFLCHNISFAQGLITIKRPNGASDQLYTDLNAAINDCPSGSVLVLSGGTFNLTNYTITINKEIHIRGAGHVPDSTTTTGRTVISGGFVLANGSDNSSFEGFTVSSFSTYTNIANTVKNIRIERVHFSIFYVSHHNINPRSTNSSNFLITKCVFSSAEFSNAKYVEVSNSIIHSGIAYLNGFASVSNNIFLRVNNNSDGNFREVQNTIIENNIFRNPLMYNGDNSGNQEYNNLSSGTWPYRLGYSYGNISNASITSIFANYSDANTTSENIYLLDLHIQANSVAKNASRDGTDLGIYGGTSPYLTKPSIPSIDSKTVAKQTNAQSELPVNFQVTARN